MRLFLAAACVLAAGFLSGPAAADLIEFKDGTKLQGTVKSRTASEVVIEFDFGTTSFAPGDIVGITPEEPTAPALPAAPMAPVSTAPAADPVVAAPPAAAAPEEVSLQETVRGVATIFLVMPDGSTGAASGIFINANGATLTNAHVVEGMQRIVVVDPENAFHFKEPRRYDAAVIKTSPYHDLALIDIHCKTPHYLRFADEDSLAVGDPVMAIGNPRGLAASVSQGIVSAIRTNREMRQPFTPLPNMRMSEREFGLITWLQTDASINPGNSGGPLLNRRHEIVGMNTFIVTQSGGSQGLNFALHVKHLKKFAAGYYKPEAAAKPDAPAVRKTEMEKTPQDIDAVMLIKAGKVDEGLALMQQLSEQEPGDAHRHMNFGSMLMQQGQRLWEQGDKESGNKMLKQAEQELLSAAQLYGAEQALQKGHVLFLMGDLYYALEDQQQAKAYYEEALRYAPQHGGALAALQRFSTPQAIAPEKPPPETPRVAFDGRSWRVGYEVQQPDLVFREYVLEGETVERWRELVTVESMFGTRRDATLKELMRKVKARVVGDSPHITWTVIRESDQDVLYEWKSAGDAQVENQHEVARAVWGQHGTHLIHYVIKQSDMPPDLRRQWIALLEAVTLEDSQTP